MPARSVYIVSPEGHTGKSVVALGLLDLLTRRVQKVGVFRPVTTSTTGDDQVVKLLLDHGGLDVEDRAYESCVGVTYEDVHTDPDAALATIVDRYRVIERESEVVVIVGSDYTDVAGPTELAFNARIATNLGAPVLLVVSAFGRAPDDVAQLVEIAAAELAHAHATTVGLIANRCDPSQLDAVRERLCEFGLATWAVPETPLLSAPLVADLMTALDGEMLFGDETMLNREVEHMLVCGMNVEHVLERLLDGQLCIAAGDRPEVLVALASAHAAEGFPSLAGIVLNGGFRPGDHVVRLVRGLDALLPVITTAHDSYDAARIVASTRGLLGRGTQRKIDTALSVFEEHIAPDSLLRMLDLPRSTVVTPLMFESMLLERARVHRQHVVLAEGDDERILRAASTLLSRQVVDLTLLGVESQVRAQAAALGLDIDQRDRCRSGVVGAPRTVRLEYTRLRAHKGMTLERARDIVGDVSYFATMMVLTGHADGMVSGAAHSTAHTITPSFEVIKTAPGIESVSSVFLMCLADRVLVYGDCAVIPDPTVEELAGIAISSAATAAQFGIEPRVAMLSYSTGESGTGADVDKVRAATELVKARRPDLPVDGPIQYDAAVDAAVGKAKLPGSDVAGRATVFIFPDLNTGNNTYKAVQRSAGAVAIGPILQGLNKPVNDLSRGATVRDIVNTVAITAIQAYSIMSERGTAGPDEATRRMSATVLVLNSGSSSIKYELVDPQGGARLVSGLVERIGEEGACIEHSYDGTTTKRRRTDRNSSGGAAEVAHRVRRARPAAVRRRRRGCRPSRRHGRRAVRQSGADRRRRRRHDRPAGAARPAPQPGQPRRHRRRPRVASRHRPRRRVRHRLLPRPPAGRRHLRPRSPSRRAAFDPSLRLPRHVPPVRVAHGRRGPRSRPERAQTDRAAPRQRGVGVGDQARGAGRHVDGSHTARRTRHGNPHR